VANLDNWHSGPQVQLDAARVIDPNKREAAKVWACRLAAAISRMSATYQQALLTLQRKRTGGNQQVTVKHIHQQVNVTEGGQAVVGGRQGNEQMVNCYPKEAELTGLVPRRPLLKWDLADLLKVAKAANWLPSGLTLGGDWDRRKAKVGDYAEVVRMMRNLVHPAKYVKNRYRSRMTARHLRRQFEFVLLSCDWLAERNNNALREHMREEGLSDS
jgi:hypothetical protein